MIDNAGKLLVHNGVIKSSEDFNDVEIQSNNPVYEVVRIIEGVPLFWEEHYIRMESSLKLLGRNLNVSEPELKMQMQRLINANMLLNCNVKLIVYREEDKQNQLLYISKSYYPGKSEIENGVKTGLLYLERKNPNAKVVNQSYKEAVSKKIQEGNLFEVLLVNESNMITEGSRSNVFLIKGNKVYTAPGELVLKGITRKYVIDACRNAGVELVEEPIPVNELRNVEGLFVSGTSIKVLPVCEVDEYTYDSSHHPVIVAIRDEYDRILDEYIKRQG